jgi:hypothetical protein
MFHAAFKMNMPRSHNYSCNDEQIHAGSVRRAESPGDLRCSGSSPQFDRAEAGARRQIDDNELSSTFRQH